MPIQFLLAPVALGALLAAAPAAAADVFDALAQARQRCGASAPLRQSPQLDEAARRMGQGASLNDALRASGYRAQRSVHWTLRGYPTPRAALQALVPAQCRNLADPAITEAGVHRSGTNYRIVAAVPFDPPAAAQSGDVAGRVLALVNRARAQARSCGGRSFGAAPPLALNVQLTRAATAHAQDMARHGYLEHRGRDGSSPADRADRAGYQWRSVGENVASGQTTPEDVVRDWLRSPEHCANIMDPRFTEMGLAFAVNPSSEGGIYWAQAFGRR